MKSLLAYLLIFAPSFLYAQSKVSKDTIYQVKDVDKAPDYPGGYAAFSKKIAEEVRYPKEAREKGIQGKVILRFVVNEDGSLSDLEVIQSIGGGCDEEAKSRVNMKKKWTPGIKEGKPVKVYVVVPVSFKLGID